MFFLVDVLLAGVPMVEAYGHHGWLAGIAIFLLVLSVLRVADKLAVERRYGFLWRILLKLFILIAAQGLVAISVTRRGAFF
jgi:hypothetical protein